MIQRTLLSILILASLLGCTVGPDYHGAPLVGEKTLKNGRLPNTPQEATAPVVDQWWQRLQDPQLDRLISAALAHNPDIASARAVLAQSRAGLRSEQANGMPKGSVGLTMLRTRSPDLGSFTGESTGGGRGPLTLYLADFDASWEVDLFGGTRRAVEAAAASSEASAAQLADAQVQLTAEITQVYVELREQQARLALVDASADIESQMLELTQQRRSRGVASQLQLEQVLTQEQTTRSQRLPLQAQIVELLDQLAALCGMEPGELDNRLRASTPLPALPTRLTVADPATLLRNRPDIRAAERELASANAQIGEKTADWFPKLSLMGDLGFSAGEPSHLVRKDNGTWLALPRLTWNALDFGRVQASVDSAKAGRDEAEAKYRGVILSALRDADVALARYGHDRQNLALLRGIEDSAARAADLTRERYRAGTANTLDWLDAERTRFDAQQNRIKGDAQLLKDFVSLHKALGLGWQA